MVSQSAALLLAHYEGLWSDVATRNARVCERALQVSADAAAASERAERAAGDWAKLQHELNALPQSVALVHELGRRVTAACGRLEALELRLTDARLANVEVQEVHWRHAQVLDAEAAHQRRQAEREEQVLKAQRQVDAEQEAIALDRQRAFQAQFEAERDYMLQHGELHTFAPVRAAAAPAATQPSATPHTIAEFDAGGSETLDDFYADD